MQQIRGLVFAGLVLCAMPAVAQTPPPDPVVPPPTAKDWAAIAALPDLSGTWSPDLRDQFAQERSNPPAWTAKAREQIEHWHAEEQAGRPKGLFIDCLPHGMPSLMTITHNALEFLVTPGRVTILGESDGNRLRRIWTDGRTMPEDPDPSFDGYSVGHWEGGTLVVETKAIIPQSYIAISESIGISNGGDMAIRERIHLIEPDVMAVDLEISAPKILTAVWKTRRLYHRKRQRSFEIAEGVCRQGDFHDATDKWGNTVFELTNQENGNLLPPSP